MYFYFFFIYLWLTRICVVVIGFAKGLTMGTDALIYLFTYLLIYLFIYLLILYLSAVVKQLILKRR